MSVSIKLRQLESKLSILKVQHQHLLSERQKEVVALLGSIELTSMEDDILLGAFLFLKDKVTTQDPIVEDWQEAGRRFFRRTRQKHSASSKKVTTACSATKCITEKPQSRKVQNAKTTDLPA